MDNPRIMLVLGERQWTLGTLHLACAVARSNDHQIILLKMVPVRQPLLLGTDMGYVDFTFEEQCNVNEYTRIAASYGVCFEVCVLQYANYIPALMQAADQCEATVVFAALPHRLIPLRHRIEVWWLKRALCRHHRSLYLLEQPDDVVAWTLSITLPSKSDKQLERQSHLTAYAGERAFRSAVEHNASPQQIARSLITETDDADVMHDGPKYSLSYQEQSGIRRRNGDRR
jgi:hypothetical protein